MASSNTVKMVCPNSECINKSVVYRKLESIRQSTCKACGSDLIKLKLQNSLHVKQDNLAKRQLKELGNL